GLDLLHDRREVGGGRLGNGERRDQEQESGEHASHRLPSDVGAGASIHSTWRAQASTSAETPSRVMAEIRNTSRSGILSARRSRKASARARAWGISTL